MKPSGHTQAAYVAAFSEIVSRIAQALEGSVKRGLPLKMYVAGGAAMYLYTGVRVSEDIDAVFSQRIALPKDLEVSYLDDGGAARLLYFDYQYNDTLGLMHEDAHDDSVILSLKGIDAGIVEVRLLSPLDLAVSKIGRLADHDRDDIAILAKHGLVRSGPLRRRAEEALAGYVGDTQRLRNSIDIACQIAESARVQSSRRRQGVKAK